MDKIKTDHFATVPRLSSGILVFGITLRKGVSHIFLTFVLYLPVYCFKPDL